LLELGLNTYFGPNKNNLKSGLYKRLGVLCVEKVNIGVSKNSGIPKWMVEIMAKPY